jgi:pyruvate formate lyase activating enzyme
VKGYPIIYSFNRSSEAGNDKFAFSLFLGGCNLMCPYCMNPELTNSYVSNIPCIDNKWLEGIIAEDRPKTIHISGGEPTNNLWNLMGTIHWLDYIKETHGIKFDVGMSTNGTLQGRVGRMLKYLSFVTMDFKGDPFDYNARFNGGKHSFANMIESWRDIRLNKREFEYEIRTTLAPNIVNEEKIRFMSKFFVKGEKWILQPYRATDKMLSFKKENVIEDSAKAISDLFNIAMEESVANVELRYV